MPNEGGVLLGLPSGHSVRYFAKKKGKKKKQKSKAADEPQEQEEEEEEDDLEMEEFDAKQLQTFMRDSCTKAEDSLKNNLQGVRSGRPDASKCSQPLMTVLVLKQNPLARNV